MQHFKDSIFVLTFFFISCIILNYIKQSPSLRLQYCIQPNVLYIQIFNDHEVKARVLSVFYLYLRTSHAPNTHGRMGNGLACNIQTCQSNILNLKSFIAQCKSDLDVWQYFLVQNQYQLLLLYAEQGQCE